jgi:hypothetical protein
MKVGSGSTPAFHRGPASARYRRSSAGFILGGDDRFVTLSLAACRVSRSSDTSLKAIAR